MHKLNSRCQGPTLDSEEVTLWAPMLMHICYLCDDSQSWWWSLSFLLLLTVCTVLTELYCDNWKRSLYCMLILSQYTAVTEIPDCVERLVLFNWNHWNCAHQTQREQSKTACNYPGGLLEYNQLLYQKFRITQMLGLVQGSFVLQSPEVLCFNMIHRQHCPGVWTKQKNIMVKNHSNPQNDDWQQAVYFRCSYLLLLKFYTLNQVKKSYGRTKGCPTFCAFHLTISLLPEEGRKWKFSGP